MDTLVTHKKLEALLRRHTDTANHSGDFNPLAPDNLTFNIAWELYYAMKREPHSVHETDATLPPVVGLSHLSYSDRVE